MFREFLTCFGAIGEPRQGGKRVQSNINRSMCLRSWCVLCWHMQKPLRILCFMGSMGKSGCAGSSSFPTALPPMTHSAGPPGVHVGRVFMSIDTDRFEESFPASTRAVFSSPKEDTNVILRLTAGQCAVPLTVGPGGSASHVASAFATHSGLTLAQRVVADKSGETEVLLPLPEGLDPAPTLISLDALYARKSIAQSLVGNGADDLVALKKNNKRDHQQVVAQFGLSLDFSLSQTDLACSHCLRNARSSEAIQDLGADLDHRNLPIKVAGDKTLTRSFHTMHLCFDAASALVPGQVSPARAPDTLNIAALRLVPLLPAYPAATTWRSCAVQ